MALWQDGDVAIEEGKLHYYRTGGNKPPLILLHGITDSGLCWTRVAESLESEFDIIMPDARGHGLSADFPPTKFTLKDMAIDLIKIIQKLGLKELTIMGHSMGARVAAYICAAAPPLTKRLILEDPEWGEKVFNLTHEERLAKAENLRNRIRAWRNMTPQQLVVEFRRGQSINWHRTEYATWGDAKTQVSPNAVGVLQADMLPLTEIVPKICCPTLLLTGDADMGAKIDAQSAKAIAQMNPKIQLVHIAGAGHDIHRDKFDAYMQAVKEFISKS